MDRVLEISPAVEIFARCSRRDGLAKIRRCGAGDFRTVGFGNDLGDRIEVPPPVHQVIFDLDKQKDDAAKGSKQVLYPATGGETSFDDRFWCNFDHQAKPGNDAPKDLQTSVRGESLRAGGLTEEITRERHSSFSSSLGRP